MLEKSRVSLKFIQINNPLAIQAKEKIALHAAIAKRNFALYQWTNKNPGLKTSKQAVKALGQQLGLARLDAHLCADADGITPLTISKEKNKGSYIPYTNQAIAWHTDGYYNPPDQTIRAFILHCVQPSAKGGANQILDHTLLHHWLKVIDKRFIEILMQPDVMTIPANIVKGKVIRPTISGPVFSYDEDGKLSMRYTARQRNIIWKQQPLVQEAVACIRQLFKQHESSIPKVRLEPGQGIVCNNVIHTRTSFINDATHERIMLRARYYDKIKTC